MKWSSWIFNMANKVFITEIHEMGEDSSHFDDVLFRHWPIAEISYETDRLHNLCRIAIRGIDNFVGKWHISYQKTFIFKLSDGKEIRFDTPDGKCLMHETNVEVGRDIMKFIDEFNNGVFDGPQLKVSNEVEFMDI